MIDFLIMLLKLLLISLPFIWLCRKNHKANLDKTDRARQPLTVVVALIYIPIAAWINGFVCSLIMWLLNSLSGWIAAPASFSWMPGFLASAFNWLADLIRSVIAGLDLKFWVFYLANAALLGIYIIIKKIALRIMKKRIAPGTFIFDRISKEFYGFFSQKSVWCLKDSYAQARSFLKVFYWTSVVMGVGLMIISRYLFYNGLLESVFYPVFGVIIIGELYFFLDGATQREYTVDIIGEDEDAYKTVNYSLIRKFLRNLFSDRLLSENTTVDNSFSGELTVGDLIKELGNSSDQSTVNFALFYDKLNRKGVELDRNYINASNELCNGRSVLFNNPFYNDLIPYAFYPMNKALLAHSKVLVVLGRHSVEEEIISWLEKGIESVTGLPFMWRIGVLGDKEKDLDIGIVTRSQVLDHKLRNANSDFIKKVSFCVVIEPTKLVSTAQIGLNLLVKKIKEDEEDKKTVFCLCDKNSDGLVDAMSHILMTDITEVFATDKHKGTCSYMCWENGEEHLHHRLVPNVSRYLGIGTELSFAALKNQVSHTKWYGGEAFPVKDMRWIAKQYYYELTKYAGLPTSQEAMDDHFSCTDGMWSATKQKNAYITVEDESFNMFEILRDFSTRATSQGFVNVIGGDYLLKDYMAANDRVFTADAKAIPYIVADHTRTERNTVLGALLAICRHQTDSEQIKKDLELLGIEVYDIKSQLWFEIYKYFASLDEVLTLPENYREAVAKCQGRTLCLEGKKVSASVIKEGERFNLNNGRAEVTLLIDDEAFIRVCTKELKSAGYVCEDEKGDRDYLGSELCGHIYQKLLPGQFFTFGGKYYQMTNLTAKGQVLVRRAADHINSRPCYRQLRRYTIGASKAQDCAGAVQTIGEMTIRKLFCDISVDTPGYFRMDRYNDFAKAKRVIFSEESPIPQRVYRNKEVLCVELPELSGSLTDSVCYTMTLLFNEVFRTLFAENSHYISAVCGVKGKEDHPLTYSLESESEELKKNCIYFIEDSQLDLGLTVAVERNLERIMKIVCDYISWHNDTLEESLAPKPEPLPPIEFEPLPEDGEEPEKEEKDKKKTKKKDKKKDKKDKKSLWQRIKEFFASIFKKKSKPEEPKPEEPKPEEPKPEEPKPEEPKPEEPKPEEPKPEEPKPEEPKPEEPKPEEPEPEGPKPEEPKPEEPKPEEAHADEPLLPNEKPFEAEQESDSEDEEEMFKRKPYEKRYYLLYGGSFEPEDVDAPATLEYLCRLGMDSSSLRQVRESGDIAAAVEASYRPGKPDVRYCDFCGCEIYGVEYETLGDGRDRCLCCSRSAIKTVDEFRQLFEDVKRNMEAFFGIRIDVGIKVSTVNTATLNKKLGKAFIPSPKTDGRVLGVAIKDKSGYTLMVENSAPRMAAALTVCHELTHIWQYLNFNDKAIKKTYGKKLYLEVYEGMAKWAEIQYAYLINEPAAAKRRELITAFRNDEYGRGFLRYKANYGFSLGTVITKPTPFMNPKLPLEPEYCGNVSYTVPAETTPLPKPVPKKRKEPIEDTSSLKGPAKRIAGEPERYCYSLLDEVEKKLYDAILDALTSFKTCIEPLPAELPKERVFRAVHYVTNDHPEIFWYNQGCSVRLNVATGLVKALEFKYCMTREEADKRNAVIDKAIKPFLSSVDSTMSDYEVTLRVYENIIKLVDYDTISLEKQEKREYKVTEPDDLRSIWGVFADKKAVCAGYAKATQYLLNLLGISCVYVTSDTHAWNVVKLEGEYYHLDTTWGDHSNTDKKKNVSDRISYALFCVTDKYITALPDHIPEDELPLPKCTATKCNYFVRNGLYFEEFSFEAVRDIVCKRISASKLYVQLSFANDGVFKDTFEALVTKKRIGEIIKYYNLSKTLRLKGSYSYVYDEQKRVITLIFNAF